MSFYIFPLWPGWLRVTQRSQRPSSEVKRSLARKFGKPSLRPSNTCYLFTCCPTKTSALFFSSLSFLFVVFFDYASVEGGKCRQAVDPFLFLPGVNHLQFKEGPKCYFLFSTPIVILQEYVPLYLFCLSHSPCVCLALCLLFFVIMSSICDECEDTHMRVTEVERESCAKLRIKM